MTRTTLSKEALAAKPIETRRHQKGKATEKDLPRRRLKIERAMNPTQVENALEAAERNSRGTRNGRTTSALKEACRRAYKGATIVFLLSTEEKLFAAMDLFQKPHMADAQRMLHGGEFVYGAKGEKGAKGYYEVRCGAGLLRLALLHRSNDSANGAIGTVVLDHSCVG